MENPITIEEGEGFSEPRTPVSEPPRQPPAMEARPVMRAIDNLQNFENSAVRQLFDLVIVTIYNTHFCKNQISFSLCKTGNFCKMVKKIKTISSSKIFVIKKHHNSCIHDENITTGFCNLQCFS